MNSLQDIETYQPNDVRVSISAFLEKLFTYVIFFLGHIVFILIQYEKRDNLHYKQGKRYRFKVSLGSI